MRLYCMRHGAAINPGDPGCPAEFDRFLTDKGRQETAEAADGLAVLGLTPNRILSSPYLRARQTAEICAERLGHSTDDIDAMEPLAPEGDPIAFIGRLALFPEDTIFCVGHLPSMDYIVSVALGVQYTVTNFRKNAVAVLDMPTVRPGDATLIAYYPPEALRALAVLRSRRG